MTGQTPVRRRLIGSALRRYRENLGYALADAAGVLECDRSKISRIETGQRGIRPKELRELLTEYRVPKAEQSALVSLATNGSRRETWWDKLADVLPEAVIDYVVMESAASEILTYDAQVIPGLLQTADYARTIVAADPGYTSRQQRELMIDAQLRRQQAVLGRGVRLVAVVGEGALYQQVGGPGVMAGQLRLLAALSDVAGVSLQVLPFSAGAHAASVNASLAILRYPRAPGLGVVYLEALSGGVYREGRLDMTRYLRAFATLRTAALSPGESVRLVREIAMG